MCRFLSAITSPHDLHACPPADRELILISEDKAPCALLSFSVPRQRADNWIFFF